MVLTSLMAIIGYILISSQSGKEHQIHQALQQIQELHEKYALHYTTHSGIGYRYDFLVTAISQDSGMLQKFVENHISTIQGVSGVKIITGLSFEPVEKYTH